jgi:hypothetical protein
MVAEIAARQHGVISLEQLLTAGLSRAAVSRRVRAGRLHRVYRGVYAVGHTALSARGRWKAATLAFGPRAVLSHRSAAELWEILAESGADPQITLPGPADPGRRRGIRAHRSATLNASVITSRDGIPVTRPARTLADLKRTASAPTVRRARRQAEYLGLPLGDEPGDGTRSDLESDFLALCQRSGIPQPEVNVPVGPFTVDFMWRDRALVIEVDGYRSHRGRQAFTDDRVREARLVQRGIYVQRFSDWQIDNEPEDVVQTVWTLLRRSS